MRVSSETLNRGWVVMGWWVSGLLLGASVGAWASWPHLVQLCASANKPCMVGGWLQVGGCGLVGERVARCVGWCVNWFVTPPTTPPITNISLSSNARQHKNMYYSGWVCGHEGGGYNKCIN